MVYDGCFFTVLNLLYSIVHYIRQRCINNNIFAKQIFVIYTAARKATVSSSNTITLMPSFFLLSSWSNTC